jgi:hypothetical protein
MKHLHVRFILASVSCGFGALFIMAAAWNVHALTIVGWTPIRTTLTACLFTGAGLVLMAFGWQGIRQEMYGLKKH